MGRLLRPSSLNGVNGSSGDYHASDYCFGSNEASMRRSARRLDDSRRDGSRRARRSRRCRRFVRAASTKRSWRESFVRRS